MASDLPTAEELRRWLDSEHVDAFWSEAHLKRAVRALVLLARTVDCRYCEVCRFPGKDCDPPCKLHVSEWATVRLPGGGDDGE